jgi:hypothetical protein
MGEVAEKSKWPYLFKAISFLVGAGLLVVGVLDVLGFTMSDPITIVLPIYYM